MPISDEVKLEIVALVDHAIQKVGVAMVEVLREYIRQSKSSFLNAYGSSIIMSDLLHKNHLITDAAYNNVQSIANIFSLEAAAANFRNLIFGAPVGLELMVPKATTVVETMLKESGEIIGALEKVAPIAAAVV